MTRSLVALAIALMSATPAAAQGTESPELVVTAQVAKATMTLGRDDRGKTTCGLTQSSGDIAIDSALCKRASRCLKRGKVDRDALDACIDRQKQAFVAAWRRGERS